MLFHQDFDASTVFGIFEQNSFTQVR
jgi:hypothetical protein